MTNPGDETLAEPTVDEPARPRLLVVDDQPSDIQILREVFHRDHEVFFATNAEQVIELAQVCQPDLILLDVMMPRLGGLEACRRLKEEPDTKDVPIIFVTSLNSPEDETRGLEMGAVDFITKPVNPAVVRARVRAQLISAVFQCMLSLSLTERGRTCFEISARTDLGTKARSALDKDRRFFGCTITSPGTTLGTLASCMRSSSDVRRCDPL